MLNYYRIYLLNLANVLEPLHKLLRESTRWDWGNEQGNAFKRNLAFVMF